MNYNNEIDKRVNDILDEFYKYNERKEVIDIVKLAEFYGFEVCGELFPRELESRVSILRDFSVKSIEVNNMLSVSEKRYVIAYELACYFLYYGQNEWFYQHKKIVDGNGEDDLIKEVTSLLLIPRDEFIKQYYSLSEKYSENKVIDMLKNKFYVPQEVIERRIDELKNNPKLVRKKVS